MSRLTGDPVSDPKRCLNVSSSSYPVTGAGRWVSRFSRVTSGGRYLPEVDGLRFIAIGSVFIQHLQQAVQARLAPGGPLQIDLLSRVMESSRIGVELFFVISGFILGLPFAAQFLKGEKPVLLGQYYARRLTRLEPPYLLSLLLVLGLAVARGASLQAWAPHVLASALYVHNLVYGEWTAINTVTWSLEVEVQFYVLAPFLAGLFRIEGKARRRGAIALLAATTFLIRHAFDRAFFALPMTLLTYLPLFLAGFLLADIWVTDWKSAPRSLARWDLMSIPGWIFFPFFFLTDVPGKSLLTAVFLFALVYASFRSSGLKRLLSAPALTVTGGMCYSIYLLHLPLIQLLANVVTVRLAGNRLSANVFAWLGLFIAAILPVAAVYFLLVEKPCMQRDWPVRLARSFGLGRPARRG